MSYHRCVSVIWAGCWVTLCVMEGVLTPPLPEGRLDTLHDSLYLYLSIIAFPLSSYAQVCSLSLPGNIPLLSLAISVSVLHLILSTSPLLPPFPPCAPLSHGCEQVTGVKTRAPPKSVMWGADGPLCPFSTTVDRL